MSKAPKIQVNLTADQQQQAVKFLCAIVNEADEQNPDDTGYDNHADTLELRLFLIEVGAMPDRRAKRQ